MMLLEMAAGGFGDRVAVGSLNSGLTVKQIFDNAGLAAQRFRNANVENVAMIDMASPSLPICLFGASWAGLPFVPLNYSLTNQELKIHNKLEKNDIERILYSIDKQSLVGLVILSWALSANKIIDKEWISILDQISNLKVPIFPLKAKDLLNFGLKEGPIIGEIFSEIEQDWIDSNFELNKEDLLLKSKMLIGRKGHNIS